MEKFNKREKLTSAKMNKLVGELNANTENIEALNKTLYDEEVGDIPTLQRDVEQTKEELEETKLFKFPNATIVGNLNINHGQVSGFSRENYLILPFAFNVSGKAFELNLAFTTGSDINTPQNIIGSKFCLAAFIQDGKLNTRISTSGNTWEISKESSFAIRPNTTYYVKLSYDRLQYKLQYSLDGKSYSQDWVEVNPNEPKEGLVYIGVGNNFNNPFNGIVNLNKCELLINNQHYWEGMDDAGLATRLATDLSNIDNEGEQRIKDIIDPNYVHTDNNFTDEDKQKVENAITDALSDDKQYVRQNNMWVELQTKDGGYIKPADGIPSSDMTEAVRESLGKADTALQPVEGKQLTTEDFTTALKEKLEGLTNYDDTDVRDLITSVSNALDSLTGTADTTAAIDTFNEVISFLDNFKNTDNLTSVLSALKTEIEQWVEGKNYLTEHQSLAEYVKKEDADNDYQPKGDYLTEHQDISGKADKTVSATSLPSDGVLVAGTSYKLDTIASLTINGIPTSDAETTVYFTADEGFTMSIPDCNVVGELSAEAGKSYVMSILNGIVVMGEVTPYNN